MASPTDDIGALAFDDDILENEQQQKQKQKERELRIKTGVDPKITLQNNNNDDDDNENDNDNNNDDTLLSKAQLDKIANLSPEEREQRWGFSHEELKAATKVVSTLFSNPHLFVGDPVLADTRLFTMVSRDRATKKNNREIMKKMLAQEQKRKNQLKKAADLAAVSKTKMKQERDDALKALLLPPVIENDEDDEEDDGDVVGDDDRTSKQQQMNNNKPKRKLILSTFEGNEAVVDDEKNNNKNKNGDEGTANEGSDGAKTSSASKRLNKPKACHICHTKYSELDDFYYSLCPACASLNYSKRLQTRDLRGRKVLLTGCRIKIGYEIALSLLRNGAVLIGTTRFVHDALNRFIQEKDYDEWKDRIHLFALDLRDLWMVEQFCSFLIKKFKCLFAIINNAAQTIARTIEYTESLRFFESQPIPEVRQSLLANKETVEWMSFFAENTSLKIGYPLALKQNAPLIDSSSPAAASPTLEDKNNNSNNDTKEKPSTAKMMNTKEEPKNDDENDDTNDKDGKMMLKSLKKTFPRPTYDRYDLAAESTDLRTKNSWMMNLHEVEGSEAAETMLINALAPFIFNAKLQPMLEAADEENGFPAPDGKDEKRFIINVSAMEGQFYRYKQTTHPHTNMAKAALNMLSRTSGADLAKRNIFCNSVDTGWVTDELPNSQRQMAWTGEKPLCPIDELDGAARVLDLVYIDSDEHSKFWKDYKEIPW